MIGDCYFLAALSALAEVPQRISDMFLTKRTNYAGCYAVKLFQNGEAKVVVVDDYFPYDETPEKDHWAFGRVAKSWEIWVNILEKACAKMLGSYEAMEGGKPCAAFMRLTGFPSDVLRHSNVSVEELWKFVI